MDGTWGLGRGGLDAVQAELSAAAAAVQEALDGLRHAHTLGWESTAGDAFRSRLGDVAVQVLHQAAALDEVRLATARVAAHP